MNIAIVGCTGMVGRKFIEVVQERKLYADNFYLYASAKSAGTKISVFDKEYTVIELTKENVIDKKIDIALFSAGASVSREFAPIFASIGATVVDNSSQWRMDESVPLVVPEVNEDDVLWNKGIIANPNCSTIQAMLVLKPLDDAFGIKRVVFSTYQACSGAGVKGYNDLKNGIEGKAPEKFPVRIFSNCIPHIDVFMESGYTKEEEKMMNETRKILHRPDMKITATAVRVPVYNSHSESINIEFNTPVTADKVREILKAQKNVVVIDDAKNALYPTVVDADGRDEVFVGRIREDKSVFSGVNLWCVADNIRKGAATNAVQIAQSLIKLGLKK
ncbi:MAG: aspartate-semialdehyde dehydrogenase [Clostridia bacterium]|nr:aspartate-semialdehyde dehydrogenase [Clostridia bacterium]